MFCNENSKIAKPNGPIAMSRESENSETAFVCGVDAKGDEQRGKLAVGSYSKKLFLSTEVDNRQKRIFESFNIDLQFM